MNKQKKISLSALQSRSTRMRMLSRSTTISFFGTTISFVPSSSVPINRLHYTKEQLKQFIKDNPYSYCNEIMGVSCQDGWTPVGNDWNKYGPYTKWFLADGRCPYFWQTESPSCPSGCWFYGCV